MIKERIHLGKLNPSNRYADIEVDIQFNNEQKEYLKLKAFIDTGAGRTAVNERLIQKDIALTSGQYRKKKSQGAGGEFNAYVIPNISIRLNPLMEEEMKLPLDYIETMNSETLPYDIIIGNDILVMCEFMYNGLSETYILKLFHRID